MHLLWQGESVPPGVAAFANVLTQRAGWERIQSLRSGPPPDAVLLDWGPTPPRAATELPVLWIVRRPPSWWAGDEELWRNTHLASPKDLRQTDFALCRPTADGGPELPVPRDETPASLPRGIVLAAAPGGEPAIIGLQGRDGAWPMICVGVDVASHMLSALGAEREIVLAKCGHPVQGLFARTHEPEHTVKFPWVNYALDALLWCCDWLAREARRPRVRVAEYPEGRAYALALSHDVDVARRTPIHVLKQVRHTGRRSLLAVARGAPGLVRPTLSEGWSTVRRENFWSIDACVAADEALGVRSSFYFYCRCDSRRPVKSILYDPDYDCGDARVEAGLRTVVDRGGEVGLHGSYRSHEDPRLLAAERTRLEECLGRSVTGVRQHFLQGEAPHVWRTQAEAGLAYDTSWSYRDRTGFRSGAALPYQPWDAEEERTVPLWELPLVLMDGQLYDRECLDDREVWATLQRVLEQLRLSAGAGAADWHQRFFADPTHPWRGMYERMVSAARGAGAWLGPCGALVDWWRARARLRWHVRRDGARWQWRIEAPEPVAQVHLRVNGLDPASVELAGGQAQVVAQGRAQVTVVVAELGPDRPCEFTGTPAAS